MMGESPVAVNDGRCCSELRRKRWRRGAISPLELDNFWKSERHLWGSFCRRLETEFLTLAIPVDTMMLSIGTSVLFTAEDSLDS